MCNCRITRFNRKRRRKIASGRRRLNLAGSDAEEKTHDNDHEMSALLNRRKWRGGAEKKPLSVGCD